MYKHICNRSVACWCIQGPPGVDGAIGATGTKGPQGADGAKGHKGVRGSPGNQGAEGNRGPPGPFGAKGNKVHINEYMCLLCVHTYEND